MKERGNSMNHFMIVALPVCLKSQVKQIKCIASCIVLIMWWFISAMRCENNCITVAYITSGDTLYANSSQLFLLTIMYSQR